MKTRPIKFLLGISVFSLGLLSLSGCVEDTTNKSDTNVKKSESVSYSFKDERSMLAQAKSEFNTRYSILYHYYMFTSFNLEYPFYSELSIGGVTASPILTDKDSREYRISNLKDSLKELNNLDTSVLDSTENKTLSNLKILTEKEIELLNYFKDNFKVSELDNEDILYKISGSPSAISEYDKRVSEIMDIVVSDKETLLNMVYFYYKPDFNSSEKSSYNSFYSEIYTYLKLLDDVSMQSTVLTYSDETPAQSEIDKFNKMVIALFNEQKRILSLSSDDNSYLKDFQSILSNFDFSDFYIDTYSADLSLEYNSKIDNHLSTLSDSSLLPTSFLLPFLEMDTNSITSYFDFYVNGFSSPKGGTFYEN